MDNYVKDNKNCHLLVFISLLSTRKVFEQFQLKFLVVGHTHENIDESFGYLLKKLKEQNNCHGRFDESIHVFPRSSIHSAIHSRNPCFQFLGQWILERWSRHPCQSYRNAFVSIFVDKVGLLVMQYKVSPTDALWSTKDSSTI
jgi:hypothetical protein